VPRPSVSKHTPLHVTVRGREGSNFRRFPEHAALKEAMHVGRERFGFRLIHYAILKDHLHFVVEAEDKRALRRGMQGLSIRMAKAVNRQNGARGKVFTDRYHAKPLTSPRQVRSTLSYVLNNYRRHAAKNRLLLETGWLDPHSSSVFFDGWRERVEPAREDREQPPVVPATVWLLTTGWRRHGPIPIDEVPGAP
jgi:REP element-mobilizing transposase RayT